MKTITGPLKLLQVINLVCDLRELGLLRFYLFYTSNHTFSAIGQVWAYSRMTICKPICRRVDWDTNVEFPSLNLIQQIALSSFPDES